MGLRALGIVALAFAAGCGGVQGDAAAAAGAGTMADPLASSHPIPPRFEIGRAATPEEIADIDIDISPDGAGLPPGSGTAAVGEIIYMEKCASCHGAAGEIPQAGNRLVGRMPDDSFAFSLSLSGESEKTIGNYWPYATTVFDYIRRAMPFDRPGSLTDDEVYAITAYLLHLNAIIAADAVMTAHTLPQLVMPAAGRFVEAEGER